MLKIRHVIIVLGMLLFSASSSAQLSISIGLPNISIGINVPAYPQLYRVPGYPVYYAPQLEANFFFYDGMYWVYQDDNWYTSSWYNGPWWLVSPEAVPVFVLRVPVRYYRHPPAYFRGWRADAPPRWGDHWGRDWERRRSGWDKWNRRTAPPPAPLPAYQRQYSKERYPQQVEQQHALQKQNYRYQPRDPVARQHYQEQAVPGAPAQQKKHGTPQERGSRQQDIQRSMPHPQDGPAAPRSKPPRSQDSQRPTQADPQQGHSNVQDRRQPPQPVLDQQQSPRSQGQDEVQQGKGGTREPKRNKGQEQERGRDRNE